MLSIQETLVSDKVKQDLVLDAKDEWTLRRTHPTSTTDLDFQIQVTDEHASIPNLPYNKGYSTNLQRKSRTLSNLKIHL